MKAGRTVVALVTLLGVAAGVGLVYLIGIDRWGDATPAAPPPSQPAAAAPAPPEQPGRKIQAQLFFVAEDGTRLVGVEREVPYGDTPLAQARNILNAQFAPPADSLVSAVPAGTTIRALFTAGGDAYVDLSSEFSAGHPGGSQAELLSVYTVVHALTFNLPAITRVQLLVEGKEVDTLAGHVDLRRPLSNNPALMVSN
jgi:spore germination protein GerM